jgi:hypothetical protein
MARLCPYGLSIGSSALFRALNRNGGIASSIPRTSTFLRCGRWEGDCGYSWSPGKNRLSVASLDVLDALKFMRWASAGDVLRAKEHLPGRAWHTRGFSNCAVLTALLLGRRSWTWTPHGLYRRLVNEPGVSRVDTDALLREMEQLSRCAEIDRKDD